MSRSIYNSTYRLGLYTFTPSYSLCTLTSHHRVRCSSGLKQLAKHHSQVTYTPCKAPQNAVEGATALFVCLFVCLSVLSSWMRQNIARAYGTGVGARRGHWFFIASMLLLVIRHPTCASCVAWMCCGMSNSIKHAWACPDQSSRRGHWILIAIMLFFVLRHPTYHDVLHECVVGCPILSSMNEHVPINHRGVGIDKYRNHVLFGATSSNLCIIHCMNVL